MNFTRTPNPILDQLPDMDKSELKLTMLLVRLTFGYSDNGRHREEVRLTFSDMEEALGVARGTVNRAVQLVEDRGFFRRGRRSTWVLNSEFSLNSAPNKLDDSAKTAPKSSYEIVQKLDRNSAETRPNQLDNSAEIRPFQSNKEIKEKEAKEEKGGTPQPPYPARTDADELVELTMWQTAVDLADRWASYRGTYRRLDPNKQADADDYFRPILGLVVECGGDGELAWSMLEQQCERMIADGLTVIRAGPVVAQIRNEQQRAELPANVTKNGRSGSPAEAALIEYAALRQEFISSE